MATKLSKKIYLFFSRLSKREKMIVYVAVGIISLTILDRLILNPVLDKVGSLEEEIKEKYNQIKTDLHVLSQKERIADDVQRYNKYSTQNRSPSQIATFLLKEIGDLTRATSVYLVNIKPSGTKEEAAYVKYYVDLSCEAKLSDIINFMYEIESSQSLLKIEKYNIKPKIEGESIASCTMTIAKIVIP